MKIETLSSPFSEIQPSSIPPTFTSTVQIGDKEVILHLGNIWSDRLGSFPNPKNNAAWHTITGRNKRKSDSLPEPTVAYKLVRLAQITDTPVTTTPLQPYSEEAGSQSSTTLLAKSQADQLTQTPTINDRNPIKTHREFEESAEKAEIVFKDKKRTKEIINEYTSGSKKKVLKKYKTNYETMARTIDEHNVALSLISANLTKDILHGKKEEDLTAACNIRKGGIKKGGTSRKQVLNWLFFYDRLQQKQAQAPSMS